MRYIPTTERDYNRATKQTLSTKGKGTTKGAKYVSNEKHGEQPTRYRRKSKAGGDFELVYTTK